MEEAFVVLFCLVCVGLSACEWNVLEIRIAFVDCFGADEAVVFELFDCVGGVAGEPCHHEERCVQIDGDSQQVVGVSGREVYVWIEVLSVQHCLFENVGDFSPLGVSFFDAKFFCDLGHVEGSAVALLVLSVSEAHDFLLVL